MSEDPGIREKIETRLRSAHGLDGRGILVKVLDGVATLAGQVPHLADRLAAVRLAMTVPGVRAIADDIEVNLNMTDNRSDTEIAAAAVEVLRKYAELEDCSLTPVVYNRKVALSGVVRRPEQCELAEKLIGDLPGVRYVLSDVEVESRRA